MRQGAGKSVGHVRTLDFILCKMRSHWEVVSKGATQFNVVDPRESLLFPICFQHLRGNALVCFVGGQNRPSLRL